MFREFNNDIMLIRLETDVTGTINVMGSGDVMSWRWKMLSMKVKNEQL
jgi:hypothetical protein